MTSAFKGSNLNAPQPEALLRLRYLPAMANKSFIVRWQNGTDAAMDSSFKAYVETAIAGMEQALARAR